MISLSPLELSLLSLMGSAMCGCVGWWIGVRDKVTREECLRMHQQCGNGFNKPLDVSEELRKFLKLAAGEQISRSQVTKKVNEYVTEKGLKQGQNINLDAALKSLLDPPEGTQVTFLNIQKYINKHYVKKDPPAVATEPAAAKPAAAKAAAAAPKKK